MTLLTNASVVPYSDTILAIWITLSLSASGKMPIKLYNSYMKRRIDIRMLTELPLRPAHSMSKLKMRNGATSAHSPSGA